MSSFDRKQFKGSTVKDLKEQEEQVESQRETKGKKGNSEFHTIEKGKNKFRIYPPHPEGVSSTPFEPVTKTFVPLLVPKKDEQGNEVEGEKEEKRYPVLSSKIHSDYINKDLIDEYLRICFQTLKNEYSQDEYQEIKKEIKNWKTGLKPQHTWVMYADKIDADGNATFGKLEVSDNVKKQIDELASIEDAEDPMEPDPFSDPDEGVCLIITKDPNAEPKDIYKVDMDKERQGKHSINLKPLPLTDEQLQEFQKQTPLSSLYRNVFTQSDFDRELAGLKKFDENQGLDIVHTDEFGKIAEEIADAIPSDNDKESEEEEPEEEEEEENEESEEEDDLKQMDKFDEMMRAELKKFVKDNGVDIKVTKSVTDEQLREACRKFEENNVPFQESEEEEEEESEEETESSGDEETKSQIERMMEKMQKKAS